LTYFNTRLNRAETASSDALNFTIKPAEGLQQDISHTQSPVSQAPDTNAAQPTPTTQTAVTTQSPQQSAAGNQYFVLAMVFAALWLLTLCIWAWWWYRQRLLIQHKQMLEHQ